MMRLSPACPGSYLRSPLYLHSVSVVSHALIPLWLCTPATLLRVPYLSRFAHISRLRPIVISTRIFSLPFPSVSEKPKPSIWEPVTRCRKTKESQTDPGLHKVQYIGDLLTAAWSRAVVEPVDSSDMDQRDVAYIVVRIKGTFIQAWVCLVYLKLILKMSDTSHHWQCRGHKTLQTTLVVLFTNTVLENCRTSRPELIRVIMAVMTPDGCSHTKLNSYTLTSPVWTRCDFLGNPKVFHSSPYLLYFHMFISYTCNLLEAKNHCYLVTSVPTTLARTQ